MTAPESNPDQNRPGTPTPARTMIWCRPEHGDMVEELCAHKPIELVSAGCPTSGATAAITDRLHTGKCVDLRHDVMNDPPDLLVLMTLDGVERGESYGWFERVGAIVTVEPIFDGIADYDERSGAQRAWLVPALRHGKALALVDDWREDFGTVRSVAATLRGGAHHGSLYTRLVDGVDVIERLCGPMELVDAAMSGPTDNLPSSLRAMHGHVSVNARFATNCCASLHVSDSAGSWARGLTILGEGGCLRLTDRKAEWTDSGGAVRERCEFDRIPGSKDTSVFVQLIMESIDAALDPRGLARAPHPTSSVLACCEAIRLSLNTGQSESPRKLHSAMA